MSSPSSRHELFGARLQRIDSPERDVLAVSLRHGSQTRVLTLFLLNDRAEACLLDQRPRGEPANAFAQKARRTISNGRLINVERLGGRKLRIRVIRGEHHLSLVFIAKRGRSSFVLSDETGRQLAKYGPSDTGDVSPNLPEALPSSVSLAQLQANSTTLWPTRAHDSFTSERSRILKRLRSVRKRTLRKIRAISADMSRIEECENLRHEAQLILTNLANIPRGATTVEVQDWAASPPGPRTLTLQPHLSPQAQAEKRFARARKLERGYKVAQERLQLAESELRAISEAGAMAEQATTLEELRASLPAIKRAGIRIELSPVTPTKAAKGKQRPERRPYRAYRSSDGLLILVGRGGHDNDRVTLDHARPHDRWLHARGTPGAHVVIRLAKNQDCPAATLLDAATLAAHFSKYCRDNVVDVQHTERRYVRKAKGSAPGSVTVERERVIACRMEADRIQRLLASEESND